LPPVRTRTWFHNGAWAAGARISAQYAREYYQGDTLAKLLPDTILPTDLSAVEVREACRALKGQVLRQEVYADDGTAQAAEPYTVSERSYEIRAIQPVLDRAHGVYFVHPREAIEYHYERNPKGVIDPRVTHAFTLEVDAYGSTLRSAAVGYPRRTAFAVHDEQKTTAITLSEVKVAHHAPAEAGWYRLGVPIATRSFELLGLTPAADTVLTFAQVLAAADAADELPYEQLTGPSQYSKRLLSHAMTFYAKDDRTEALPFGEIESLALPWQSHAKAFTSSLLASALDGRATKAILTEGGYVRFLPDDDAWWIPSSRAVFSGPETFYLPTSFCDPFGNTSTIVYDEYLLAVVEATDPLGNTVLAEYDYRVLAPVHVTDANGNRAAAQIDALGMVVATAVMGKEGDTDGDTLDDPTTTFTYDLTRFATTGEPNVVHSRAREQHGAANIRWQEAYSYSDGSGREVMRKIQAEPGLAPARDGDGALVHDGDGALVFAACDLRWVGTGRTVFDNKGNPVKQYEPFFSSTHEYEDETELVEWGVTPVLRYDALGRLIRTDLPNGTFSKVEFDPWKQTTFDPNDTVAPLDPADTTGESLWYQARKGLDPDTDPEGRAALLAHVHRGTPGVAHLDALGRTFLTIEDNGAAGAYATRVSLDLEGNPLVITDARLNTAMEHIFGMGGRVLWQKSCDAGERWMLSDVGGALLRAWDERGHTKRATYDAARRATHQYVQQDAEAEQLVGRTVYGEAHPDAAALNLRGKAYQVYDGAGVVTNGAYDFKGNLLAGSRRLAARYRSVADWSPLAGLTDIAAMATAAEALLEAEVFISATAYDALNRPTSMTAPDASEIRPTYNEAGLLEKVEARVRGAVTWTTFVDDIDYDAKGQREKIVYGNGTRTTYTYDPETFRLVRLKTVRDSDNAVLQNLTYTYDPVGNITEIKDSAQQTVFFDNDVVSPSTQYVYDALYRLIEANGREHVGGVADVQRDQNDVPLLNLPHANDALALRNYVEKYVYDAVGNILTMTHVAGAVDWTRRYEIAATSNRLLSTSLPGDGPMATHFSAKYAYDEHGSMTSMPHLASIGWDHNDQMQEVDLGGGGTAYYTYDAAGQRVRKVWEHSGLVEERIYLGGWEVYRKRDSRGFLLLERETLHGMDGARRIVLVETKSVDVDAVGVFTPVSRLRFQLDNHLGSASLEVDESGLVIGYEEYHPYGTTAYASGRSGAEVSGKRYRYTGKERDEETGLYYHGARHYAAWLARWTRSDPAGFVDGTNTYCYVRNNPGSLLDAQGTASRGVITLEPVVISVSLTELRKNQAKADYENVILGLSHPEAFTFGEYGQLVELEARTRPHAREAFAAVEPSTTQQSVGWQDPNEPRASAEELQIAERHIADAKLQDALFGRLNWGSQASANVSPTLAGLAAAGATIGGGLIHLPASEVEPVITSLGKVEMEDVGPTAGVPPRLSERPPIEDLLVKPPTAAPSKEEVKALPPGPEPKLISNKGSGPGAGNPAKLTVKNGRWTKTLSNGTTVTAKDTHNFVVTKDGQVLAAPRQSRGSGHVDLSGGAPVRYAGEVKFNKNGEVMWWTNGSGHYKSPTHLAGQAPFDKSTFRPWAGAPP
jgi:RHS repeat-associated protein